MNYKKALITGATSGIGNALIPILLHEGIACIASGRDIARLKEIEEFYHIPVVPCDLTGDRESLIQVIRKECPDLVINCAGAGLYGEALLATKDENLQVLRLNAEAVLDLTWEAADTLIKAKEKGTIMNISSTAGDFVFPGFAVYASSKTFVTHLSQALDIELSQKGVRILVSCPGRVQSSFSRRAGGMDSLPPGTMSSQYAAEDIFYQIQKLQPVRYFNWRYRLAHWIAPFLPKRWLGTFLFRTIKKTFQGLDV